MNLINRDGGSFEFLIETLDDLWVLSQVIVPGVRVFGKSERKVKIGNESSYKVVRKLIFIDIDVASVKFENNVLRITGSILNETEFTSVGSFHTLSFNVKDKISFEKKRLLKFEEKMIKNAIESKKSHKLLVMLDKDELIAVEFSDFSFTVLFSENNLGSKKYHSNEINEEEEKFDLIKDLLGRDYSSVIFAGPGISKDKLQKYVKDKLGQSVLSFHYVDVNSSSVLKVIREIHKSGVLSDSALSYESEYVNKLLENVNKGEKFVYGKEDVIGSVNSGNCEVFIVTTKYVDERKKDGTYVELNELMRQVEQINGRLVIVNSKNETGKIVDGLGGIACILRY